MLQMHQSGDLIEELKKVGIRSALLDTEKENTPKKDTQTTNVFNRICTNILSSVQNVILCKVKIKSPILKFEALFVILVLQNHLSLYM